MSINRLYSTTRASNEAPLTLPPNDNSIDYIEATKKRMIRTVYNNIKLQNTFNRLKETGNKSAKI